MTVFGMLLGTLLALDVQAGQVFDVSQPPGANFDQAAFRLWIPAEGSAPIRGLVVLTPGSNGDGRSKVDDVSWQSFARSHHFGLVGVFLTDHRHPNMAIEHYVDVRRGSGQAFFDALGKLAEMAKRPEVATAPLLLWGMSAGGEFNYELTLWRPERILGFVVNKGGIYYNVIASEEARQVPGLFFMGEKDSAFRNDIIQGIYSVNRRFKARWALVVEPGVGHAVGRSRDLAKIFFAEWIERRLGESGEETGLAHLSYEEGFLGDPQSGRARPSTEVTRSSYPWSWLATETLARAWEAAMANEDF